MQVVQIDISTQTGLHDEASYNYDPLWALDATNTDRLRPKKTGQMHIKLDSDLAIVGTCYITYDLLFDGKNILDELALRVLKAKPTFTGTVSGITKEIVGLTNVSDVSDADIPVSTTAPNSLNLKAASVQTFTSSELDELFSAKQRNLLVNVKTTGVSLVDSSYIVKGLNVNAPLSVTKASSFIMVLSDSTGKSKMDTLLGSKEDIITVISPFKRNLNLTTGKREWQVEW